MSAVRAWARGALLDHLPLKFVAMVLALTVFIVVHSDEDAALGVTVVVSYTLPEDRVMVSEPVDRVRITVKGSWRRVKRFRDDDVDPVWLDLRGFPGGAFTLTPDMFRVPPNLSVESIAPASIPVAFEPKQRKVVEVVPLTVGDPAHGYSTAAITTRPAQVTIEGAESAVRLTSQVHTTDVVLAGRSQSFASRVALKPPHRFVKVVGEPAVDVAVTLVEELESRELGLVPVAIRLGDEVRGLDPAAFAVDPPEVRVVLRGARLAIERVTDSDVIAVVEVFADLAAGRIRRAPVLIEGVTTDGVAVEVAPREVTLQRRRR
jgi:YbbR domain-containing protein